MSRLMQLCSPLVVDIIGHGRRGEETADAQGEALLDQRVVDAIRVPALADKAGGLEQAQVA